MAAVDHPPLDPAIRAASGATDGLWEWDARTSSAWYSPAFAALLGLGEPGSAWQGRLEDWQSLVHPSDRDHLVAALEACAKSGEAIDVSYRLRSPSEGHRWYRTRAARCRDASGEPHLVSGGVQDIHCYRVAADAAREREQQIMQRQRMQAVDCLAGGIAHEFNNVLQAIGGYVNFARDALAPGSEPHDDLTQALTAADRAAKLTRDLLVFARAEDNDQTLTDIRSVVSGLVELLGPVIGADIDLSIGLPDAPLVVEANAVELKQSLLNLCINARDAMPGGGQLRLAASRFVVGESPGGRFHDLRPGAYCRVVICDTGRGVQPELLGQLFDPFYTTKDAGTGAGLGLAAVYGFCQRSGGLATAFSDGPGDGAAFSLYLPLKEQAMPEEAEALNQQAEQTVLLAEDDPLVQDVARRMLESVGFRVLVAGDGESALETYIENAAQVSVVLLDGVMPRRNGRDVFEAIRRLQSGVPIAFLTGYDPGALQAQSLGYAADAVIAKPFDRPTLLSTVRSLLAATGSAAAS
ncbi:MAG: response regulator [Planctomycetota bacterium]